VNRGSLDKFTIAIPLVSVLLDGSYVERLTRALDVQLQTCLIPLLISSSALPSHSTLNKRRQQFIR